MEKKPYFYIFVFILLVFFSYILLSLFSNKPIALRASYTEIALTELKDVITVKGTVGSTQTHNIYTTLPFRTKEIMVRVGDRVEAGQVLCVLDSQDLDITLDGIKAELDVAQRTSMNIYETNKRMYEEASAGLSESNSPSLLTAENGLRSAQVTLETARRTYNDLYQEYVNNSSVEHFVFCIK